MKRLLLAIAFIALFVTPLGSKQKEPKLYHIVRAVIQCESSGRHEGVWGDNGKAYGLLQYWEETFYRHGRQAGLKNAHWKNEGDQVTLFLWALENGKGKEWSCYRKLKKQGVI